MTKAEKLAAVTALPAVRIENVKPRGPQRSRAARDDKPKRAKRTMVAASRTNKVRVGSGPNSLPNGRTTRPLAMKMPKGDKSDVIQKRLQKSSPWYQTILDPLHGADVKIPDATGVETGTLQLCQRVFVKAGTSGVAALRIETVYPATEVTTGLPANVVQVASAVNAGGGPDWPPRTDVTSQPLDTTQALKDYSDGVRVASAAIYCQSQASLATNAGEMIAYGNPFGPVPFPSTAALTDYVNHYKTALIPINNNQPAMTRWYPIDQNGGEYQMFYDSNNGTWTQTGSGPELDQVPLWELGVICNGCTPGSVYLFTIVVNYEFVPFENSINILDAKPSPCDAQEVDLVENWVQDLDPAQITTNKIVATPPKASEIPEPGEGTGFGMFFETVKELLPIAMSVGAMLL